MGYYDTMQVCRTWGHKITASYDSSPNCRQDFCEKCGSITIFKCENCGEKIRGYYHVPGVIGFGYETEVPLNCHKCGSPYPWRKKLLLKNFFKICISPLKYIIDSAVSIFKK